MTQEEAAALAELEEVYRRVDEQLGAGAECVQCGRCCHFKTYGHRLYATRLEVLYILETEGAPQGEFGEDSCGYQEGKKCTARKGRVLGCRTFFCGGDIETMRAVHEEALRAIRAISERHGVVRQYEQLAVHMKGIDGG